MEKIGNRYWNCCLFYKLFKYRKQKWWPNDQNWCLLVVLVIVLGIWQHSTLKPLEIMNVKLALLEKFLTPVLEWHWCRILGFQHKKISLFSKLIILFQHFDQKMICSWHLLLQTMKYLFKISILTFMKKIVVSKQKRYCRILFSTNAIIMKIHCIPILYA